MSSAKTTGKRRVAAAQDAELKRPLIQPSQLLGEGGKGAKQPRPATQVEQVAAVKLVSDRLRQARELNGWSLAEASERFGFASRAHLSKMETGRHVSSIPLWFLAQAAMVYEVSADFLLGVSDQMEMTPRLRMDRELSAWLFDVLQRNHARDAESLALLHAEMVVAFEGLRAVTLATQEVDKALMRVQEMNPPGAEDAPGYEDLRGGSTLVLRVSEAMQSASRVAAQLTKFRGMMRASSRAIPSSSVQMDLLGGGECQQNPS